tara:strand:+ start:2957 stop:3799 length:843 start_codon:yes stop_codon:yes gene_type:complete
MTKYRTFLSYGPPGYGKTAFGVSSFWDFNKNEIVPGTDGRILFVGREKNDDLDIPEELVKRFPMNPAKPMAFATDLIKYLKVMIAKARKGEGPTSVVLDGLSELCYAFIWGAKQDDRAKTNQFWTWNEWQEHFTAIMQMLSPDVLGCDVFSTARVGEFREGGDNVKSDPEWMDTFRYHPAAQGWAKLNMGHYYNFIIHHEQGFDIEVRGKTKVKVPYVKTNWLPTGEYMVKNSMRHKWLKAGMPPSMKDVTWPQVKAALDAVDAGVPIKVVDGVPYPDIS